MLREWFCTNKLPTNPSKANYVLFHHRPNDLSLSDIDIKIGYDTTCRKTFVKFFGYTYIDHRLWNEHIAVELIKHIIRSVKRLSIQEILKIDAIK